MKKTGQSYFLGLSMGICISMIGIFIWHSFNNIDVYPQQADIMNENISLKSKVSDQELEIERLLKEIEDKTKDIEKESVKDIKEDDDISQEYLQNINDTVNMTVVILDIKEDMSNSDIADLLIANGVYKYKNDLLMIMEIIGFDRDKYSQLLQSYGYISNSYEFNRALREIEQNQYAVTEALYENNLVRHKNSFMKLLYLLDINTKIKYGQKEFKVNSSLRDVCDSLIF